MANSGSMQHSGMMGGGGDDQERLLDEATTVVKEQAHYMKRAIESNNLREALKHSSNLICELRTSLLSPKNYYELYMQVFEALQTLYAFFSDKEAHGRKMIDLYESVQHAGSILPRMYLLATVGASYIKSKDASAKEILKDMNELTKGVQHPMRGLFLRYYLSQMVKDKLPDIGTEYEGEGGNIDDAFDFIFTNFQESNRLWCRMQNQGPAKDKAKREKERNDLRVLVGSNLIRLSQLDGMTADYYSEIALPKVLDHITTVKDPLSQQYLFESMNQVFPDEYHIKTLEKLLEAYAKAHANVNMKDIMVGLMNRLAKFLKTGDDENAVHESPSSNIFTLIRTHLHVFLDRALDTSATGSSVDISPPLEVQAAFMQFTISLYPDKIEYVDLILQSTVAMVKKFCASQNGQKLSGPGAEKVCDLLGAPLRTMKMSILEMGELTNYTELLKYLNYTTRKQVAMEWVRRVVETDCKLDSVTAVQCLFGMLGPLLQDEDDTPRFESLNSNDKQEFANEQQEVCKLVHQIMGRTSAEMADVDVEFEAIKAMRNVFGAGGPSRLVHTLPPVIYFALGLVPKVHARALARAEAGEDGSGPQVSTSPKKILQFLYKTLEALQPYKPTAAFSMWLVIAAHVEGSPAMKEEDKDSLCYEFLKKACVVFDEDINESIRQYEAILQMVGTMMGITCLDEEHWDHLQTFVCKHAARLLQKPMQCRAVAACSHLGWTRTSKNAEKVQQCLERSLKIFVHDVQSNPTLVLLTVEMLDKYIYYYENDLPEECVNAGKIQSLLELCIEHIGFAQVAECQNEARKAKDHLRQTIIYLRKKKSDPTPEVAAKFASINLDVPGM